MKTLLLLACVSAGVAACAASPVEDGAAFEQRLSDESYCVHSARVAQQERAGNDRSAYLECIASRHQQAKPQDVTASAH